MPNIPANWQNQVLSAMAGVVLGVIATHSNHGARLDAIERSISHVEQLIQRLDNERAARQKLKE